MLYKSVDYNLVDMRGWAGHVARMGVGRGVHRVLVGKPEGGGERCAQGSGWET